MGDTIQKTTVGILKNIAIIPWQNAKGNNAKKMQMIQAVPFKRK
jgi:hypothetical protein